MQTAWGDSVFIVKIVAIILFGLVTLALFGRICEYSLQLIGAKKYERLSYFILAYLVLNLFFNITEFTLAFLEEPNTDPPLVIRVLSSTFLGPPSLLSTIIHILLCTPIIRIQHFDSEKSLLYSRIMVVICIVVHIVLLAPNYISYLDIKANSFTYYRMAGLISWIVFTVAVDLTFSISSARNLIRVKILGNSGWNTGQRFRNDARAAESSQVESSDFQSNMNRDHSKSDLNHPFGTQGCTSTDHLPTADSVSATSTSFLKKAFSDASLNSNPNVSRSKVGPKKSGSGELSTLGLISMGGSKSNINQVKEGLGPSQIKAFADSERATMRFVIVLASFDVLGLIMFMVYVYYRMWDSVGLYQCFRMLFYVFMTAHHIVISYFWVLLRTLCDILSAPSKDDSVQRRRTLKKKDQPQHDPMPTQFEQTLHTVSRSVIHIPF